MLCTCCFHNLMYNTIQVNILINNSIALAQQRQQSRYPSYTNHPTNFPPIIRNFVRTAISLLRARYNSSTKYPTKDNSLSNFFSAIIGRQRKPKKSTLRSRVSSALYRFNRSVGGDLFDPSGTMGQEASTPVDESIPPETLESRDLEGLAKYIKSGKCKKIVIMSGAGISTSAGIPDFRSPDTGLYANLARLNLPFAEAVFDISYFRENPEPFYALANELYPGRFRPTPTHSFISLLHEKSLLLKHFTQNIDCLDREAGVPGDKIIEAHGSFADQACIDCSAPYPRDKMLDAVNTRTVARCESCKGLVKPKIVFFGEALPAEFFANRELPMKADLAIVMGTSLTVQPFASLPSMVPDGVPRVLINLERVGGLGSRADDVLLLGDCDEGVWKIARACGWEKELKAKWDATKAAVDKEGGEQLEKKEKSHDEEVEELTREVDKTLKLSGDHEKRVKEELGEKVGKHLEGKGEGNEDEKTTNQGLDHVFPHLEAKDTGEKRDEKDKGSSL